MLNSFETKYQNESSFLEKFEGSPSGKAAWECPSNIALVKYWGKKPVQLPLTPSLSLTLNECKTIISIDFSLDHSRNQLSLSYFFEDLPKASFESRYYLYLQQVSKYLPFLNHSELVIRSRNTFPHSSGIASSASSFGALALSLCSIERNVFGTLHDEHEFLKKASFLARLGSGSASRSVYGGFSIWGRTSAFEQSADEISVPVNHIIHPVFKEYCDNILVIHSGEKEVPSSAGHQLMERHPYYSARILQANDNLKKMISILEIGDEPGFIDLIEEEAFSIHALMMTSRPGYFLLKPASMEVLDLIRQFRKQSGLSVGFTLDAGANVHLLHSPLIRLQVDSFIESQLSNFCEDGRVIRDAVGKGPVKLH